MAKDFQTLRFEQDVIILLRKHNFLSKDLIPTSIIINVDGSRQPLISISSKLKTEAEKIDEQKMTDEMNDFFDEDEEDEEDLIDEDDDSFRDRF